MSGPVVLPENWWVAKAAVEHGNLEAQDTIELVTLTVAIGPSEDRNRGLHRGFWSATTALELGGPSMGAETRP
jgi:hypothetical protein